MLRAGVLLGTPVSTPARKDLFRSGFAPPALLATALAAAVLVGHDITAQSHAAPDGSPGVWFTDITNAAGLEFHHTHGASADKHLVETMGSGAVFFDSDGDGWIDIFLVDGGSVADPAVARQARHRLYRNRGDGTFEDVTARSGIRHSAYGMGACAGDIDNDGAVDLYITSFGPNVLYRNRGDGTFADITAESGTGSSLWGASCAFADIDRDGLLDLFVTNYVDADPRESPFCGNARLRLRFYCHPLNYRPLPNTLYRNRGGGRFADISEAAGIAAHRSNGLGVVIADLDDDGWPDVFVANDSMPNFLFRNTGDGRFTEMALTAGVAFATDGQARAGMGTDAGDYDGDGRPDLVVTNLDFEMHSLHRNLGERLFAYTTIDSGLGLATLPFVGFGAVFFDADHDMRLDLAIANGHIMDNAPQFRAGATHAQRNLLFHNLDRRRFVEVGRAAGPGFAIEKVSRGLFAADIDNDGDLDLLVTNNGQAPDLLRNERGTRGNSVLVRVVGTRSNRDGIGARLRLTAGGQVIVREIRAGSSYLGQNDIRAHVGLGAQALVDRLEVRWPGGATEVLERLPANRIITIREGDGVIASVPFGD